MFFITNKYLISSILNMALISYGHFVSSNSLVILGLLGFIFLLIVADDVYKVSILFLFVSFNGLLKINLEGNSFFGLGVLLCTVLFFIKGYKIKNVQLLIFLFFYTLINKLFLDDLLTLRYFFTFIFLILLSFLGSNLNNKKLVNFELYVKFFAIGTIASNFIASLITKLPKFYVLTKGADIQLEESWGIFRFAGFNGDPNRNALQIAFATGCLLVLTEKTKRNKILSYLGAGILIYYGFQSISKMFYLILGLVLVIYFIYILIKTRKAYQRLLFLVIFVVTFFIAINTVFVQDQIELLIERNQRTGNRDITTGRIGLQLGYINYLLDNIRFLFFGRGFLTEFKPVINVAHNSLIQGLFGLGLAGFWLFLKIIFSISVVSNKYLVLSKQNFLLYSIPTIILFTGIMSLDLLSMDAFYFYLILTLFSKEYIFHKV